MSILKSALINVAKRYWLAMPTVLITSAATQYWRHDQVSPLGLLVSLLAVVVALSLSVLPVEILRQRSKA